MKRKKHPFTKFLHRTGHYPRAKLRLGDRTTFYISTPPDHLVFRISHQGAFPYIREYYLTYDQTRTLLKWLIPLHNKQHRPPPDSNANDLYAAQARYAEEELKHLEDLRRQKRERRGKRLRT